MIAYRLTIIDNKQNETIDDFYYAGMTLPEGKTGTGLRQLSREFIAQRKMLDRLFMLSESGRVLEVTSIFKDRQSYSEFVEHDIHRYSLEFFESKNWQVIRSVFNLNDYKNLKVEMFRDGAFR